MKNDDMEWSEKNEALTKLNKIKKGAAAIRKDSSSPTKSKKNIIEVYSNEDSDEIECNMEIIGSDEKGRAIKKAMDILLRMEKTEWQLRDKLKEKGYSEDAIEKAVEYVKGYHYLDDERYARRFVEFHHDKRSIVRLKQDLKKRHVSDECIELALENIEYDDSTALYAELSKILSKYDIEELTYEDKQKIMAKVYRKGYKTYDIKKALQTLTNKD